MTRSWGPSGAFALALAVMVSALPLRADAAVREPGLAAAAPAGCATLVETSVEGTPQGLAVGPDGRLWFTYDGVIPTGVQAIHPAGSTGEIFELVAPRPTLNTPRGLTSADGALWFVGFNERSVIRMTTGGSTSLHLLAPGSAPRDIAAGGDGNMWFTEQGTNRIGRIATTLASATYTAFPVAPPAASGIDLWGITAGPDGNLWFTEYGAGKIGRITAAGAITEYALGAGATPQWIIAAYGGLWFSDPGTNSIGRITTTGAVTVFPIPTPGSVPGSLTSAPDGGIWFTETAGNRVARLDRSTGAINETPITVGTQAPNPRYIVALPDGTIWFTEDARKLGHFKVDAAGAVQPLPPELFLSAQGPQTIVGGQPVYSTRTQLTVQLTSAGTCADSISYRIYPAAGAPGEYTTVQGSLATFNLPADGDWVIQFFGTGSGGVTSVPIALPRTVDNALFPDAVPPTIGPIANVAVNATGGLTPVSFDVLATDNVTPQAALVVSCAAPTIPPTLTRSGATATWSGAFPAGATTVTCAATDESGNSVGISFTVTVTVIAPQLTLPADVRLNATALLTPVTFAATATSPAQGQRDVTCVLPDGPLTSSSSFSGAFPPGTTAVSCSASDGFGNTTTGGFQVTVVPDLPWLRLPEPMSVRASGPVGLTVTYAASASSFAYGALAVDCAPPSGRAFPIGTNTVSCSTTDPAGQTVWGSFAVTVLPPPVDLRLPASFTVETFRDRGAIVAFAVSASSPLVGRVTPMCTPASGTLFPVGVAEVVCTADDGRGGVATGVFTVTVVQRVAPHAIHVLVGRDRDDEGFEMKGTGLVIAEGGGIMVNTPGREAVELKGSGRIEFPYFSVVGGVERAGTVRFSAGPPQTGAAPTPDPYATLADPSITGLARFRDPKVKSGSRTLSPGVYDEGITISGDAVVTFRPGIYVLRGHGLRVSGSAALRMDPAALATEGVLFFNTRERYPAGSGDDCGEVKIEGSPTLALRPLGSGPYRHLTIFQDRRCDESVKIEGSAIVRMGGIYAPQAALEVKGRVQVAIDGQVVVGHFEFEGSGRILVEP